MQRATLLYIAVSGAVVRIQSGCWDQFPSTALVMSDIGTHIIFDLFQGWGLHTFLSGKLGMLNAFIKVAGSLN